MPKMLRVLFTAIFAFALSVQAAAQEVISEFDVAVDVSQNGDFTVTETITVNVQGNKIKRGIFRDLPRYYLIGDLHVPFRYKVKKVTRNGRKENYDKSREGNAYKVRIGDADVFLPHGDHTYQVIYTVKDEIRRDDNSDFVYWNVTGNYWNFPIDKARVKVSMPAGAALQSYEAFTGRTGATGNDARLTRQGDIYVVETTRPLSRREGVTVRLKFDKGVIAPTPDSTKRFIWWVRNGAVLLLSLSLLAMLYYYYGHWSRVGRDPVKLPVFARYEPPEGYSAAAVSRIHYNGVNGHKAFIATLIGLAVKNRIMVETEKKKVVIEKLDVADGAPALNAEEDFLWQKLSASRFGRRITLRKGTPHIGFTDALQSFLTKLNRDYSDKYFRWNAVYIIGGIIFSVVLCIVAISQFNQGGRPGFGWLILAMIALNILFVFLMPAPTKLGQQRRGEIEGFRLFMKTAERGRLNAVEVGSGQPPAMNLKRYEALLPYAIALGVERPWAEYFEAVMPQEAEGYSPVWGNLGHHRSGSLGGLTDNMVSNMSSGVSSSIPQSSGSSSSGGGGGFSGGGGGGGGGGGW